MAGQDTSSIYSHLGSLPANDDTLVQHAGHEHRVGTGLVGALEQSVTYSATSLTATPVYARLSNTRNHYELMNVLAALHGAEASAVFGSGMAAMTAVAISLLRPGDHVIAQENCYGGNMKFLTKIAPRWNVTTTFAKVEDWGKHIKPNTKLALVETISNPFCVPQNLALAARNTKGKGITLLCDNTFASPYNCKPLQHGVDLVLESATKYLNGHSDVVAGMVAGRAALIQDIYETAFDLGGFLSTAGCMQLLRGLRTFTVRMARHNANGKAFAEALRGKPFVKDVYYGPMGSADDSKEVRQQFLHADAGEYGGMVTVRFAPGIDVLKMLDRLTFIRNVPSLAGTETTMTMPFYTTHFFMTESEKAALGVDKQLVRISIGLEDVRDVIEQISAAAQAAKM